MITNEELAALVAFSQNDRMPIDPELVSKLNALCSKVQQNLLMQYTGLRKRNSMLQEKVDTYTARKKADYEAGTFEDSGLDSVHVAAGLLYCLQQLKTYKLNKGKLQYILYEMYASWLASKKERLCLEQPVLTDWGPRFWRVYKRLDTGLKVPYESFKKLQSLNPGVAVFCKNAANKYYDYDEATLKKAFLNSAPVKDLMKREPQYTNKPLQDADIFAWKNDK